MPKAFDESKHPRAPKGAPDGGQWVGGKMSRSAFEEMSPADKMAFIASGGGVADNPMHELFDRISKPDGGFTYNPLTGDEPHEGFAVSIYPEHSVVVDAHKFTFDQLVKYAYRNYRLLQDPANHLGTWHDPDTHKIFLDVSIVAKSAHHARQLALDHDQKAYFDLKAGHSVEVNQYATSGGIV